jgi:thiamine kinase-like enzyme
MIDLIIFAENAENMPLSLEKAIARVPQWAGISDLKATPLGGGITNNNFRIDAGGQSYVLRITGENSELLGINREYEFAANLVAGKLGIAPEVFFFIRPEGSLVTRFIKGRPIPPDEIRRPENIRRVMEILRKIHNMPEIPGRFDAFRIVAEYSKIAHRYHVSFPYNFNLLIERVQAAEKALQNQPVILLPCHNDLLNANFLTNGPLYVLDWEYAGMGDIFFDLANFSDHHNLSDEQDRWLLQCYHGEVTPNRWAHLKIMKIISELREATWALVQIGISKLEFDFRTYADEFLGRAVRNIQNSEWKEWLKEVS